MAELLTRFTGDSAETYDQVRESSERWLREREVFARFIAQVNPKSVLDCPFGTGRWAPEYKKLEGPIVGVDLSADMLEKARAKFAEYRGKLEVIRDNALSCDFSAFEGCDLTVCVRFLNWLPAARAKLVVENLARARSPHAIFGASVIPPSTGLAEQLRMRTALLLTNGRGWAGGEPFQYVHREQDLLSWFDAAGLTVDRKEPIFTSRSRVNYFYLLRRIEHP